MKKVTQSGKKKKNMKDKEEVDTRSELMKEVDKELDALREIVHAIEGMEEEAKVRTFRYLKDRYGKEWPSS
jgi:hypothetical protein